MHPQTQPSTLNPEHSTLTPKQQLALAALLQGSTQSQAARQAGCSERSIRGWLQEPAFAAALQEARAGLWLETTLRADLSAPGNSCSCSCSYSCSENTSPTTDEPAKSGKKRQKPAAARQTLAENRPNPAKSGHAATETPAPETLRLPAGTPEPEASTPNTGQNRPKPATPRRGRRM